MKSKELTKQFTLLKKEKDYTSLGALFWSAFMTLKGKPRKTAKNLWGSLTKKEKALCESGGV